MHIDIALSGKLFDFRNHAIKYCEQEIIKSQCNMSYIIPFGRSNSLSPRIRIQSITMMSTNIMFLAEQGPRPIPPSKLFLAEYFLYQNIYLGFRPLLYCCNTLMGNTNIISDRLTFCVQVFLVMTLQFYIDLTSSSYNAILNDLQIQRDLFSFFHQSIGENE